MPKTAASYLSTLRNRLNQRLGNIARAERNKQAALRKAKEALTKHFLLVVAYTERKVRLHIKLSSAEKTVLIKTHVADALTDFGKILDDRRQ